MAKLPSITSNVPKDLRVFLDRVREAINGTGGDSLVSVRQLVAAGIATQTGTGITSPGGTGVVSTPIRPENVQAAGALANIMVTWDKPIYSGHAYAEVWAASRTTEQAAANPQENPTLGQAELVGMAPGVFFAHNLGAGATRFYWVRFVNVLGEVGPYQSTEGISGQTSVDPTYMLEVLTGAITESELYTDLSSRIDLIDGAATLSGSVAARIQTETTNRTNALALKADASLVTTLTATVGANTSAISDEADARADADTAEATARTTLQATIDSRELGFPVEQWSNLASGASKVEITDGVVGVHALKLVDGSTSNQMVTTDNAIQIDPSKTYRVKFWARPSSGCTGKLYFSLRQRTATGYTSTNSGRNPYRPSARTKAQHDAAYPVDSNGNSVFGLYDYEWTSSDWHTGAVAFIPEFLDNHGTGAAGHWHIQGFEIVDYSDTKAAVQTEAEARVAADGVIEAKYTVKVDVGGHVAGYGLIANANDGAIVSEFGIRADQFFLAPPTIAQNSAPASADRYVGMSWVDTNANNLHRYWNGTAWVSDSPSLPFIVRTSPTTINGEAVPAGVYIRDGFIQNGTIVNASIGDAAVDNAKIANVNAGKINAGFIDAARIEAGSIDANKIDSRGLSIQDSAGNIILAAGTPLSVDNYVAPPETSSLFYNSNFTRVAADGRPAGVYSCNSSSSKANISFQDAAKTILKIATPTTDTSVGGALQAIRVDPNVTYMIYARVKATANKSSGFYMRARELDTELANGVNFIGGSSRESGGVAGTRTKNFVDFNAGSGTFSNVAITNSFVDIIGEYKPTGTAKWMSVEFLNWTDMGTEELHIAHCIIATKQTKLTASNASTFIDTAAITMALIEDEIKSTNYNSSNNTGWKLDQDGTLDLNSASITAGTLQSTDGNFVINLTNGTITISS